jgi:hypothetical protein
MSSPINAASALPSDGGEDVARPKNLRGGRKKRVAGEPTKPWTVRWSASELARVAALAEAWGLDEAEAIRRAVDEAHARLPPPGSR